VRVCELSPDERPREKLLARGAEALTDVELLAVLLRTGRRGAPVLEYARDWLDEEGGLAGLATLNVTQLLSHNGVGPAKGAILAAALELGRRLARERLERRPVLDRPELVADYLAQRYASSPVELFGVVALDARHRVIEVRELHRGGQTTSPVEPKNIFRQILAYNANALILWHTHPSGDPTPSQDDLDLTRRLVEGGRLLNVQVLDHIVIARSGWVSLRQRGAV
jgi:DNA repair protein RadC